MGKAKFSLNLEVSGWIRHLMLGWLCAVLTEYILLAPRLRALEHLEGIAAMSLMRLVLITVGLAAVLRCISLRLKIAGIERWGCAAVFTLIAIVTLRGNFSWPLLGFFLLVIGVLTVYAIRGWQPEVSAPATPKKTHWGYLAVTALLALGLFAFISAWGISRVLTLSSPSYDFGIFSQMFYYMKTTGLPLTTLERSGLLSHFHVHISPIYYLMLPIYRIFPYPVTLQILQAAVITSAVIPMWLIGKQKGLSGLKRTLLCALLLFLPTTAGGAYYDLHENCFLLPLILWLMYAIERKSILLTALFGVLTLTVKEDAAVYVAVIALYVIVTALVNYDKTRLPKLLSGIGLLILALVWFFAATGFLASKGDGVMTYRYANFDYDGSGSLITVVKSVLLCPMKLMKECTKDPDRLRYIAQTLLPLLGLPLLTRKFERYILLIPYILINLMPDWQYQYDIFFQYSFGSSALLLYLCAVNLADIRWELPRFAASLAAVAVSLGFFCTLVVPKAASPCKQYLKYHSYYENTVQILETIPADASVTAHTFYTVPLSQRDTLYDLRYCSMEQLLNSQYVVIKTNSTNEFKSYELSIRTFDELESLLVDNGFVCTLTQGTLKIYQKAS